MKHALITLLISLVLTNVAVQAETQPESATVTVSQCEPDPFADIESVEQQNRQKQAYELGKLAMYEAFQAYLTKECMYNGCRLDMPQFQILNHALKLALPLK
jgi:hypothetical protein